MRYIPSTLLDTILTTKGYSNIFRPGQTRLCQGCSIIALVLFIKIACQIRLTAVSNRGEDSISIFEGLIFPFHSVSVRNNDEICHFKLTEMKFPTSPLYTGCDSSEQQLQVSNKSGERWSAAVRNINNPAWTGCQLPYLHKPSCDP